MANWKKSVWIASVTTLLLMVVAASGHAWGVKHQNTLTFSRPIALPGVVLPPGSYSFGLMDSNSSLDVVEVSNANGTKLFYRGLTNTVERPLNLSKNAVVTFREALANEPQPVAVWYPIGTRMVTSSCIDSDNNSNLTLNSPIPTSKAISWALGAR